MLDKIVFEKKNVDFSFNLERILKENMAYLPEKEKIRQIKY